MTVEDPELELLNRRHIYQTIDKYPGIHFRELYRKSNISMGSLEYHLNILERNDLIYAKKESGFTRYFVKGKLGSEDKELASMLQNDKLRKMVFTLVLNPGLTHKNLTQKLGWPKSTISFYLKKLLTKGVVEEREQPKSGGITKTVKSGTGLFVTKPDRVIHLVTIYKTGFFDELANRILDLVETL
jgi:predicted transcriptional regulator